MPSSNALRLQLESALAHRIPSAFTPEPRIIRPVAEMGIRAVDELLCGGLPIGAITEIIGPHSSGRTSFSLSFLAQITQTDRVCAWVDVSNTLHPESAAAAGVDLNRLLWVRCGVPPKGQSHPAPVSGFTIPDAYLAPSPIKKGLHGGGCGGHPRMESRGLSEAIGGFFSSQASVPPRAEPQRRIKAENQPFEPASPSLVNLRSPRVTDKPWARIEQALRVTDLLLQSGGFSSIVLDMGGIAPEFSSRVPLATWFRYQKAAERSQVGILLLTQHACAKSSAGLVLRLHAGDVLRDETTVFPGMEYRVEAIRERFNSPQSKVIPLRKPPQRETGARWQSRMAWAGSR